MKNRKIILILLIVIQLIVIIPINTYAKDTDDYFNTSINTVVSYLKCQNNQWGGWGDSEHYTADIANIIENVNEDFQNEDLKIMCISAEDYLYDEDISNNDSLSRYLLLNTLQDDLFITRLKNAQNPDGGFGLSEGYASDIIDTKLALKTLADLTETQAMTKAAVYIASLQNDDGGFPNQPGLTSNPELTAEIADILADCIIKKQSLSDTLSDTIHDLNEYLEANAKPISEL